MASIIWLSWQLPQNKVLLGMMSHNFFHPCPCSHTTKNALNKKGNQCTIANLRKLFWDFFESRSEKKKRCKKLWECNTPPIVSNDQDKNTTVLCLLSTLQLHLIGPVNKMYSTLEAIWPPSVDWLWACSVKKEGGIMVGVLLATIAGSFYKNLTSENHSILLHPGERLWVHWSLSVKFFHRAMKQNCIHNFNGRYLLYLLETAWS